MSLRQAVLIASLLTSSILVLWGFSSAALLLLVREVSPDALLGLGALLVAVLWLRFGLPRFTRRGGRRYLVPIFVHLGVLATPFLPLPLAGLWFASSPSRTSLAVVLGCVMSWGIGVIFLYVFRCPECGGALRRKGIWLRLFSMRCATCGVRPGSVAA